MKDWRIKYYINSIITEKNKRLYKEDWNCKYIDENWVLSKLKPLKKQNSTLEYVELLQLLYRKVKEGEYDKN